jgi:hypothetical protein
MGETLKNVKANITDVGINLLVSLSTCNNLDAALMVWQHGSPSPSDYRWLMALPRSFFGEAGSTLRTESIVGFYIRVRS